MKRFLMVAALLALPVVAHAQTAPTDVSLFDPARFSLAVQVGLNFEQEAGAAGPVRETGEPFAAISPAWSLGSRLALVVPVRYLWEAEVIEFSPRLSVMLWAGGK